MQTLNLNSFISGRVNQSGKNNRLFNDVLYHYIPDIKEYGWLAGGAIRRLITGADLDSDFDFFFKSKVKFDDFYISIRGDKNIKIKEELKNEFNLKLTLDIFCYNELVHENIIFQLININYYENPEDLLKSFDFTLCQFATDGESLFCGDTSLWDTASKKIVVNKITYPVASLRRMFKYTKQGYYACAGSLSSFLLQVLADPDSVSEDKIVYID